MPLPASVADALDTPVRFPSGRAMLLTIPVSGAPPLKMMGIVEVARLAAAIAGAALDIAELGHGLAKQRPGRLGVAGHQEADSRHRLRLRWQRGSRGQRHEMTPSHHSMTSSAVASNSGGIVSPSGFAVRRLITSSNLVDCATGRSAGLAPLRM